MDNGGEGVLHVDHSEAGQPSNLNISDVIEAITKADPLFGPGVEAMPRPLTSHPGQTYVRIVEQPAGKALRFRYECEGRSAGSIPGVNSTLERKTYPTIEIVGYKGDAVVVVSCVTREQPYRPHPHNLVGRERSCENGVCTVKRSISEESPQVSFSNLGIQCVKRKDIAEALKTRERLRVDPFKTGFGHRNKPQSIDLNTVRLCFQVFLPDERTGKIKHSLPPVVSDVIYDKKAMSDLVIMRVSQCSDFVKGGAEIILLCERVTREDISVVFFQKEGDNVVWEESAHIVLVHRQYAIAFHTPPYRDQAETGHVQVYLQLKRISDNARSNAVPFEYIPEYQDTNYLKHKRLKKLPSVLHTSYDTDRSYQGDQKIKAEPRDKTPPHPAASPLQVFSPHYEQEQMQQDHYQQQAWGMQGGLNMAGPSHINYGQDLQWSPNYVQLGSNLQPLSPNMTTLTSNMQQMSSLQPLSPNMQRMSPNMQAMSPNMQAMSPNMQALSPLYVRYRPNMQAMSPNMQTMSPSMHGMSPNLQAMNTNMQMGMAPLLESPLGEPLTSSELSGLAALLDRGPDLSDSLNRLSTGDLYPICSGD
ncbi:dorsal [Danaus plexippus plexippus]|uniref:Dorsal n=1 Tax=Danaus plexippus plexippus TaxID=278856 RepID=A0A212EWZ8_DANPL|nr:dorsal [Danaus plexippus plexippus]